MLVIFLNVGCFSENQNNIQRNATFIGQYYDDSKKRYSACHYSYHFPTNKFQQKSTEKQYLQSSCKIALD